MILSIDKRMSIIFSEDGLEKLNFFCLINRYYYFLIKKEEFRETFDTGRNIDRLLAAK